MVVLIRNGGERWVQSDTVTFLFEYFNPQTHFRRPGTWGTGESEVTVTRSSHLRWSSVSGAACGSRAQCPFLGCPWCLSCFSVSCWYGVHSIVTLSGHLHHLPLSLWLGIMNGVRWSLFLAGKLVVVISPLAFVQLVLSHLKLDTRASLEFLACGYHPSVVSWADASFLFILYSAVHFNRTLINRSRYLRHGWIFLRSQPL